MIFLKFNLWLTLLSTIPTPTPTGPPRPPMAVHRVISTAKSTSHYISKTLLAGHGCVVLTNQRSESLQVEYNSWSTDTQALRIPDDQIQGIDLLGIVCTRLTATWQVSLPPA